jgi:predicted ester cyclase
MGQAAEVMRRDIAAFNDRDVREIMAVHSSDCEKAVPGARLLGSDQVVAWRSALWEAFPDIQLEVTRAVEEGSAVAIQGLARATHRGTLRSPSGDIPPTGRSVEITWSDDYEVRGGRIVSTRLHFDQLSILEQLGVTPVSALWERAELTSQDRTRT